MPNQIQIHTIWRTASEQCEIVWNVSIGYRTRLWVHGRLVNDEWVIDDEAALRRAWELHAQRHAPAK
jgi:hypothetical protein